MFKIKYSSKFKKDIKKLKGLGKNGKNIFEEILTVVEKLANKQTLEPTYKDHDLKGNYNGYRECHIRPDWLLIYRIDNDELQLVLFRTGTHSELFN